MRYLQIFTISILLISCSFSKNVTTDLEKIGLTGKVKSLKFEHERNSTEKENTYFIDNEFYFNQNGMIYEQRQYSSEGLIHINSYNYDKKNLLISKTYFNGSREFVNKSKIENAINKKGKLIKQSEYRALGNSLTDSINLKYSVFPDQITEFLYDSNWNLIKYNVYDRMSSFIKEVTELNNGEIMKSSTVVIEDGEIFSESIYDCVEYDSKKNCIRYKVTENDSTESFINAKIEYNK
ncbi:hypothetical protein JJL45_11880 [Tamlana sp. s12]|uniref:hypothetical protein n=1 Tax=Tamlana sp. s12 TaxID=1630406 RepID=UPI0007FFA42C|nr:hypothetical protein [Tamlana sp. s12]OBQ46703.1 hypothetical protein VQ01_15480 [Tamlana sp. s12]QQY81621.1 hypothetical protein JJL45_11880 [Tamlana sp. s12]